MTRVEFENDAVCVDAGLLAQGLALDPALVRTRMREGKITSVCERGVDEDAGRLRLTFYYSNRRLRLLVDEAGNVIERSTDDIRAARPHARRGRAR